jgi:hypothetical protein
VTQQQPQPYAQPLPPKKKRKWPIVLLVLVVLFIAAVGGCMALVGGAANEVSKSLDETEAKNAPRDVKPGAAFTIGKHQTLAGWTVKNDGGMFAVAGKVKNTSTSTSSSFIHFKFLSASGEVLGNVQCNSGDLEPGQTQALSCLPDGKFAKYAKVTAEATF